MKNDFISIYTAINIEEQKAFKQYIKRLYSSKKTVLSLFDQILKAIHYKEKAEDIRKNFITVKTKQNDYADLKKWLLQFLVIQEIEKDTVDAKFLELEALRKRGLFETFEQKSNLLTQEFDNVKHPHQWLFLQKLRLLHISHFNLPIDRLQAHQQKLLNLMHTLDEFYISTKLIYSAELYNRTVIMQDDYDIFFLDVALNHLDNAIPRFSVMHTLYKPMLTLNKNNSHEAYHQLKDFLVNFPNHDISERQAVILHLLNFTTRQLRKGEKSFIQESFDLYQFGVEQLLFINSGYFYTNTFLNIVNTACYLSQFDWVKNFVNQQSTKLLPDEKKETESLAKARIAFEEKKFEDVIDLLLDVNSKNFNFELNIRTLQLRAYYELRNIYNQQFLLYAVDNLYFYIKHSKKIGKPLKDNVFNFCKLYRSLVKEKKPEKIIKELNECQRTVICYDWIKMKIDDL